MGQVAVAFLLATTGLVVGVPLSYVGLFFSRRPLCLCLCIFGVLINLAVTPVYLTTFRLVCRMMNWTLDW